MNVMVNGKEEILEGTMTILDFIQGKDLDPRRVAVEHNYEILDSEEWEHTILKDNDNLEILSFVGGG